MEAHHPGPQYLYDQVKQQLRLQTDRPTAVREAIYACRKGGTVFTLGVFDFNNQRMNSKGEFTPEGAIVLHLYARYCCANKFAGETDLFEALDRLGLRLRRLRLPHRLVRRERGISGAYGAQRRCCCLDAV